MWRGSDVRYNNNRKMRSFRQALGATPAEEMIPIGDIVFDNVTMDEAVRRILEMARKTDKPRYVCTANLDHLAISEHDDEFRDVYRRADLVLADGMPVVWLSQPHIMGRLQERVAGSDLFWELSKASAKTGLRLFLLGGLPGSADRAAEALRTSYPGVQICGTDCPSFENWATDAEQQRILETIHAAKPDILFVGLGAPKQEKWIAKRRLDLNVPVSIGVGGSFEMASGSVRRAPVWMQKSGLEWAYRLAQEPKRLWDRYMRRDVPYLIGMVPNAARHARFRVGSAFGTLKKTDESRPETPETPPEAPPADGQTRDNTNPGPGTESAGL